MTGRGVDTHSITTRKSAFASIQGVPLHANHTQASPQAQRRRCRPVGGNRAVPQYALAFNKAAFDAKSLADALKALGANGAPEASSAVTLTAPDIAENGAVVPLAVASTLPGIKQLVLLVEKNPNALVAVFNMGPELEASFATPRWGNRPTCTRWPSPATARRTLPRRK